MTQRILSCLFIAVAAVITACDDDDDKIKTFNAQVDVVSTASISDDKYHAVVVYSTDGGTTYVEYPKLKPGDSYKAKVIYVAESGHAEYDLPNDACFSFDWSGSAPAATGATNTAVADFVATANTALKVVVADYTAYSAGTWSGAWFGIEDGDPDYTDANTFTQDPSDPNKFVMDNYWGVGDEAYIVLSPSTNWFDQEVIVPKQVTSLNNKILGGSGVYDQCRGTLDFDSDYVIDYDEDGKMDTVTFNYHFQRVKP